VRGTAATLLERWSGWSGWGPPNSWRRVGFGYALAVAVAPILAVLARGASGRLAWAVAVPAVALIVLVSAPVRFGPLVRTEEER
jgi:hypothetical protein